LSRSTMLAGLVCALGVAASPERSHGVQTLQAALAGTMDASNREHVVSALSNQGSEFPDSCDAKSSYCEFYVKYKGPGMLTNEKPFSWRFGVGEYAFCGSCGDETCGTFPLQQSIDRFTGLAGHWVVVATNSSCPTCLDEMKPRCQVTDELAHPFYPAPAHKPTDCGTDKRTCKLHRKGEARDCFNTTRLCCDDVVCGTGQSYQCSSGESPTCEFSINVMFPGPHVPQELVPEEPVALVTDPPASEPSSSCFASETATACRLPHGESSDAEAAYAQCYEGRPAAAGQPSAERVLMAELLAGDRVLTRASAGALTTTRVLVNQHSQSAATAPLLTLHTTDGAALSLTPDHALFVDGKLAAASAVVAGSRVENGRGELVVVTRVLRPAIGRIVSPVTAAGTLLASDAGQPLLAACHPMWIAPLAVHSTLARAFVNAVAVVAGEEVHGIGAGVAGVLAKLTATLALVGAASGVLRRSRA